MNRRRFLAGVAMGSVSVAGCLGARESPTLPDGMTVETHHRVGSHLVDDGLEPSGERPHSYQTILTDRSTARERTRDEDDVVEFVEATDFDRSYLVVVVARAWSSQHWLEVREIDRTKDGIHAFIVSDSDDPTVDDAGIHSLAIRITDDDAEVPSVVAVTIDGQSTGRTQNTLQRPAVTTTEAVRRARVNPPRTASCPP